MLFFSALALLASYGTLQAQEPAAGRAEAVLLSPRPSEVAGVRESIVSLNGVWQFAGGGAVSRSIRVPGEWEMQGFHLDSAATGTYTRTFEVPDDWQEKRIRLRFDAVSSHCTVLVNGEEVGSHEGSFVPFEMDITSAVRPGANRLEVAVQCQTISDVLACTSQYAGHPVGGILRKVQLFCVPAVHLADEAVVTRFDTAYRNAVLELPLAVSNQGKKARAVSVSISLQDAEGKPLPEKQFSLGSLGAGLHADTVRIPVRQPIQWNPEHPYRYRLVTRLLVEGKPVEAVTREIGFRQVEVRGNQLFVNNRPVKLHGVCRHSIAPYTGRSVPADRCREDALLFREGNCNYIRTSHYPPEEEFLDACDSLGLFVESESSLCWIGHGAAPVWKQWNYQDPRFLPYMIRANIEKMLADRNHPSVILWSLGNESLWSPLWAQVNKRVKQLDPTRPTVFQDQCWGTYNNHGSQTDIRNYHYPDFEDPANTDTMTRPVQFDEFAHVENYNRLEVMTDPYVRVAWGPSLVRIYDSMYAHPGCLGGAIWAGIDDIFHMPDHRLIGYGPWGVIDGWRRKKPEFYAMRQAYSPVRLSLDSADVPASGSLTLQVENRYDFLNLSALRILCIQGNHTARLRADIPPHGAGLLRVPLVAGSRDSIRLVFRDPRGFVSQQAAIAVPARAEIRPGPAFATAHATVSRTAGTYLIASKSVRYQVNRQSGLIQQVSVKGRTVPVTLPLLEIVPLNDDDGGGPGITNCNYQADLRPLLYTPCHDWKASSVQVIPGGDSAVTVEVKGSYREAQGTFVMRFENDGGLRIHYAFTIRDSVRVNPRQWGLVCVLPGGFDRLRWHTKSPWPLWTGDGIARAAGEAPARPLSRDNPLSWERPGGSWSQDANRLGSNDFRSTKAGIYTASLADASGLGLEVRSDGTQSVRAWLDDTHTELLTTDYNTGGVDRFSAFFYEDERRPLSAGSKLEGTFLIHPVSDMKNKN